MSYNASANMNWVKQLIQLAYVVVLYCMTPWKLAYIQSGIFTIECLSIFQYVWYSSPSGFSQNFTTFYEELESTICLICSTVLIM